MYFGCGGKSKSTPWGHDKMQAIWLLSPEQLNAPLNCSRFGEQTSTLYWHVGPRNVGGHWHTLWERQCPPFSHWGLQTAEYGNWIVVIFALECHLFTLTIRNCGQFLSSWNPTTFTAYHVGYGCSIRESVSTRTGNCTSFRIAASFGISRLKGKLNCSRVGRR